MCLSEDSLPIISQLKALIFLLHCDLFGAIQTQITFLKQCIIFSQIRSLIQWLILNDSSGAQQTQKEFYHESILPFPIISQLISLFVWIFYCDNKSSWRIQQKCLNKLTNLITIPIRLIYYLFNCKSSIGRQISIPNTTSFNTWMGDNFNHIPLNALVLPGTHNAHSYKLKKGVSFAHNIASCQNLSIYRQLTCGARCLDIRLCNFSNELWCAHAFCLTVKFMEIMQQTLRFVKQYPSEIVILRCKTEWDWRNKPDNPVKRSQIIDIIQECDDAKDFCAPLNPSYDDEDILGINIGELAQRKWNIIVFHEFNYSNYGMETSWDFTQDAFAKGLISKSKKWIKHSVPLSDIKSVYLKGYGSVQESNNDEEYGMNMNNYNENERKILYLVNGQITPVPNCKWITYLILTGIYGLRSDVELVNAEMLKNIDDEELFKLHVWDMDFLHPLLVQKIIDTNLKYCVSK